MPFGSIVYLLLGLVILGLQLFNDWKKKKKQVKYISAFVFIFFFGFTFYEAYENFTKDEDSEKNLGNIKTLTEDIIKNLGDIDKELDQSTLKSSKIIDEVSLIEKELKNSNTLAKELIEKQLDIKNYLTGGDSFVYFHSGQTSFENKRIYFLTLTHSGDYPLVNFRIQIYDNIKFWELTHASNKKKQIDPKMAKDASKIYDSLYPIIYPNRRIEFPDKISKLIFIPERHSVDFDVSFEGTNGYSYQKYILLDIWGQPENATILKKNGKIIWSDCYDEDFPKGKNGNILWSNAMESYEILIENRKLKVKV